MGETLGDKGIFRDQLSARMGGMEEGPAHRVCLDSFYMDKHEVTNTEYEKKNPEFTASKKAVYKGKKVSPGEGNPVVEVSWTDAYYYCEALGKRLPTEAEWEYAAREGGKNIRFGNGKDRITSSEANFDARAPFPYSDRGEYRGHSTPASFFSHPNALGLYDMAGNVFEWVQDWYEPGYYERSPEKNPQGAKTGIYRVIRGGSWHSIAYFLRATARGDATMRPWQNG